MHDTPGDPVDDRLVGTAAVPRDLGHSACRRLEEDDAEALLLEAAPAIAAQHREDVAGGVDRRQVVVGDSTEEPHRRLLLGRDAFEPLAVASPARDRDLEVGPRGDEARRGLEQRVEPLPGDEPAHADDHAAVGVETEPASDVGSLVRREGTEALGVDTRRHDHDRQRASRRSLGLERGVAAGGDDHCAPRRTERITCWLTGKRPGTVTSAPCNTSAYGIESLGPSSPTGSAGSSTISSAPTSRARRVMRCASGGVGSSTGRGRARRETAARRPTPRLPGEAW